MSILPSTPQSFMCLGIIKPIQACILTNLIVKWNHCTTTLDKSHPYGLLVTNRSCASDTPITSAIFELSVLACFSVHKLRVFRHCANYAL